MNRALWEKTVREGRWLLLGCATVLFAFHWIHIWAISQLKMYQVRKLLRYIPEFIQDLFPVPMEVVVAPAGRVASCYDDPLVLVVVSLWAIARGSDCVSGEIGRGTMEMLLAQPIRRTQVLLTQAVFTVLGLALLIFAGWLGTLAGLSTIELEQPVSPAILIPPAINVFCLGLFVAGLSSMLSACDRYRWRTIGIVVGFYVVEMITKLIAVSVPSVGWLKKFTFLAAFEPQVLAHAFWPEVLAQSSGQSWLLFFQYTGVLSVLGLASYVAAAVIFSRRDLPAPL